MVRFMAENQIGDPEEMKAFAVRGYRFSKEHSSVREYVFLREHREEKV